MNDQTISEAAKKAAEFNIRSAADWYDFLTNKGHNNYKHLATLICSRIRRSLDAAARVEPTEKWTVERLMQEFFDIRCKGNDIAGLFQKWVERHNSSLTITPMPRGQTGDETGLAPCPFCGKPCDLQQGNLDKRKWYAGCCYCGFYFVSAMPDAKDDVTRQWNRRVPLTSSPHTEFTASERETKSGAAADARREQGG